MRVLLVHNMYGSGAPSGENEAFIAEREMLLRHGVEVYSFITTSDTLRARGAIGEVQGALTVPWNPFAASRVHREALRIRPDIVHVHNTFPHISPSIFRAVGEVAPRVLTLHNYRLFCAAAIPLRGGVTCTECVEQRSSLPSLKYGCYRGSRLATLPLALGIGLHRTMRTWEREVDAFVTLTQFQSDQMVIGGLPRDRLHVKPNFFPGNPRPLSWTDRGNYCVFAGRLSAEKGVASLVEAWRHWGPSAPELQIVGDGPLRADLERAAKGARVTFRGRLPSTETHLLIAKSKLLVMPSECLEGFPMVLREAFAYGTPVAVSALGALPSLVEPAHCGFTFPPADPHSLLRIVRNHWEQSGVLELMGQAAHAEFQARYTEGANFKVLLAIYEHAAEVHGGARW